MRITRVDNIKLVRLLVAFLRRYGIEEHGTIDKIDLNRDVAAIPSDKAFHHLLSECRNMGHVKINAVLKGLPVRQLITAPGSIYRLAEQLLPDDLKPLIETPDTLERQMADTYPEAHALYINLKAKTGVLAINEKEASQIGRMVVAKMGDDPRIVAILRELNIQIGTSQSPTP